MAKNSREGRWPKAIWFATGKYAEGPRSAPPQRLRSSDRGNSAMTMAMGLHLRMEQVRAAKESPGPTIRSSIVRLMTNRWFCWRTVRFRLDEKAKPKSGTPVRRGACSERRTLKGKDKRRLRETVASSTENVPWRTGAMASASSLRMKPMRAERPRNR